MPELKFDAITENKEAHYFKNTIAALIIWQTEIESLCYFSILNFAEN